MSHADFIDAIGAPTVMAETRQGRTAVANWRARGVPWRWRALLARVAEEQEVPVPDGFLDPHAEEAH